MMSHIEMEYAKTLKQVSQLKRELAAAISSIDEERKRAQREGARVIELQVKLAEAQEELNDKRKFCYDVEQALDGLKGDYVEIISALRKDAERYRWLRDHAHNTPIGVYEWVNRDGRQQMAWLASNELDDNIDAAMKEGGK